MAVAVSVLLSTAVFGSTLWFDPPNPHSRTHVIAHAAGYTFCGSKHAIARIDADTNTISITLVEENCGTTADAKFDAAVDLGVLPAGVYTVRLGVGNLLIGLGETTLTVREADPAVRVEPATANTGGGDVVLLVSDPDRFPLYGCATGPSPVVCGYPTIKFGGQEVQSVSPAGTTDAQGHEFQVLKVKVPPHAAGVVDIVVDWTARAATLKNAFLYFDPNVAPDPAFFTPVLFPIIFAGPGAFGSQWNTEVSLSNQNDYPLITADVDYNGGSIFDTVCLPVCDMRPQPHTTLVKKSLTIPGGYLMRVDRETIDGLSFGTLVRDESRQAQDLGTAIPVVREKDFHGTPFSLMNVPTDARYRITLRVYRIDGGSILQLRIFVMNPAVLPSPLVDTTLSLRRGGSGGLTSTMINDLVATFPQLAGRGPLRIEIVPETSQPASWAFVSVTNNDTQHVSVISPQ